MLSHIYLHCSWQRPWNVSSPIFKMLFRTSKKRKIYLIIWILFLALELWKPCPRASELTFLTCPQENRTSWTNRAWYCHSPGCEYSLEAPPKVCSLYSALLLHENTSQMNRPPYVFTVSNMAKGGTSWTPAQSYCTRHDHIICCKKLKKKKKKKKNINKIAELKLGSFRKTRYREVLALCWPHNQSTYSDWIIFLYKIWSCFGWKFPKFPQQHIRNGSTWNNLVTSHN